MITELNGVIDAVTTLESHADTIANYWIMMDQLLGDVIKSSASLNGEDVCPITIGGLIDNWEKTKANHLQYQQNVSRP